MEKEQLKKLMDDIDNNEVAAIKTAIDNEMKKKVLDIINVKRKELDSSTKEK